MKLAVMGKPISHSKSPQIHRAAYSSLNLEWVYERIECDEASFEETLQKFDSTWRGLSLTMPLKEIAYTKANTHDRWALASGAVNTLLHKNNEWHGFNTDIPGLSKALTEAEMDVSHTVILGTGATAVSAILAAKELGAKTINLLGRRSEVAKKISEEFTTETFTVDWGVLDGSPLLKEVSAVISTLPGPAGKIVKLSEELFGAHLFDVAYDPWPSPLTLRWQDQHGKSSSGIGMLINQAVLQIRIFLHSDPTRELPNEESVIEAMKRASVFGP
ncbi:MAG TPA: shikimate dehydrogenase [Microbacteriaceae bacterium]|nr:shikimate dehydrogenase [Microbacteriaceae bacterium]